MDRGKQKWTQHSLSFQCRPRRGDERWTVLHLQPNVLFWKQKSGHGRPSHFYQLRRKDDNRDWPTKHNSGLSLSWRRFFIWMRVTKSPWSQQRLVNTTCQKRAHFSESSLSRTTRKRQVIFLYWELSQILLFENSLTRVKTLTTISISDVISATQY